MTMHIETPFQYFRKRDGLLVPFRPDKIACAIWKAGEAAMRQDDGLEFSHEQAEDIAARAISQLDNPLCEYFVAPDE